MNRLPGDAAPVRPDEFPAPQFALGLERYAFAHRLSVRRGVAVRSVDRGSTDDWLTVATGEGLVEARSVVVASGDARVPRVPAMASALSRSILQLHTAEYRNAGELPANDSDVRFAVELSEQKATIIHVPRISEFYGIVIEMYFRDHPPPHFHARYGGDEAVIAIATGEVIAGSLPGRALRLVREWTLMHGDELNANWDLARARRTLAAIAPLP